MRSNRKEGAGPTTWKSPPEGCHSCLRGCSVPRKRTVHRVTDTMLHALRQVKEHFFPARPRSFFLWPRSCGCGRFVPIFKSLSRNKHLPCDIYKKSVYQRTWGTHERICIGDWSSSDFYFCLNLHPTSVYVQMLSSQIVIRKDFRDEKPFAAIILDNLKHLFGNFPDS